MPSKNMQDPSVLPGAVLQQHCALFFSPSEAPFLCVIRADAEWRCCQAGTRSHCHASPWAQLSPQLSLHLETAPAGQDPAYPWALLPLPGPGEQRGKALGSTNGGGLTFLKRSCSNPSPELFPPLRKEPSTLPLSEGAPSPRTGVGVGVTRNSHRL